MRYYTIQNDNVLIGQTAQALTRYYDKVYLLPEDYEQDKYIIGEVEEEIDVSDYDEEGNPIYIDGESYVNDEGINIIPKIVSTHKETVKVKKLILNTDFDTDRINALRNQLYKENTIKAKQAVEQGYIEFSGAKFETNTQTVSDLTSAMLIMQSTEMETYPWLSMDDQYIELTLEDFGSLGGLIAGFKAHIWNTEYIGYKTRIAKAQTYEELKEIVIDYGVGE